MSTIEDSSVPLIGGDPPAAAMPFSHQLSSLEGMIKQMLQVMDRTHSAVGPEARPTRASASGLPAEPELRAAVLAYLKDAGIPTPTATLAEELGRASKLNVEDPRTWKKIRDRVSSLLDRMQRQGLVANREPMGPALWALPGWPVPAGPGKRQRALVAGGLTKTTAAHPVPVGRSRATPCEQAVLPGLEMVTSRTGIVKGRDSRATGV